MRQLSFDLCEDISGQFLRVYEVNNYLKELFTNLPDILLANTYTGSRKDKHNKA